MRFSNKPDEMEREISYQAMKITWTTVNVAFIVLVIAALATDAVNPVSLVFLLIAEAIYLVALFILRHNMTKGGREE